ncbi:MAG: OmpA family protein [Acetobacteraceae bacterium]|nr:OmpA family protein [Acetobacteraceae bacterium]
MSLKKALLAATVLSLPVAAQAQPISGLYLGAGAGVNLRQNATDDLGLSAGDRAFLRSFGLGTDARATFRVGYAAVGSIGWGFGNGIRAEIEGNYRYNEVSRLNVLGVNLAGAGGRVHQYGVMANALYDINLQSMGISPRVWMPYVGVGAGYVWNDWNNVRGFVPGLPAGSNLRVNDSEGRFAYQAIVGGAIGLGDFVPGLALTGEYRFMGTLAPRLNTQATVTGPGGAVGSVGNFEPSNYNHSFLVGLRYAFNAPRPAPVVAPAPAPAAAPAPARTYLVFFDWDRADLTDRARQVIAEAAQNAQRVNSTRIEVSGHADRTGTAAYNQRLSVRRAEAVAAELVRRGIPRNQIGIQGFGFDRPLVPTAMGVREPQNRRVEIVLR